MNRLSVSIGINYPRALRCALHGCVADAHAWGTAFSVDAQDLFGVRFDVTELLLDADATAAGIRSVLSSTMRTARWGDLVVIQYSGHSTQVPDRNGDEQDDADEAWVPYTLDDLIVDDELRALLSKAGVTVIMITDACHAETGSDVHYRSFPRALLPSGLLEAVLDRRKRHAHSSISPQIVEYAACAANAVSEEFRLPNGDARGVYSYYALQSLYERPKHYRQWHRWTRTRVKEAGFMQKPQFSAPFCLQKHRMFQ